MQETQTQREKRKNMYISYVLTHAKGVEDYEALTREIIQEWELNNQYKKENELQIKMH